MTKQYSKYSEMLDKTSYRYRGLIFEIQMYLFIQVTSLYELIITGFFRP